MNEVLIQVLQRNLRSLLRRANPELRDAGELLAQLRSRDPLGPVTRRLELEYLVRARRLGEADTLGRQLLEQFPNDSRIHYLCGHGAYYGKDYKRAVQHLREAQRLYPFWKYQRWLGKALTQMGELDEAEALLLGAEAEGHDCSTDLTWLYQRKGDVERAIELLEKRLQRFPEDHFLQDQLRRLRVQELAPDELQEEVELLQGLGEEIGDEMIPEYVHSLLATGQGKKARAYVQQQRAGWALQTLRSVAWKCHHLQAFDLATTLFLEIFPQEKVNVKFLTALEKAADRCGRLELLIEQYQAHAADDKRLYGRARRLQQRLG